MKVNLFLVYFGSLSPQETFARRDLRDFCLNLEVQGLTLEFWWKSSDTFEMSKTVLPKQCQMICKVYSVNGFSVSVSESSEGYKSKRVKLKLRAKFGIQK